MRWLQAAAQQRKRPATSAFSHSVRIPNQFRLHPARAQRHPPATVLQRAFTSPVEQAGRHSIDVAKQIDQEGFAVVRKAVSAPLLADIVRHVEWLRATYPDIAPEQLHHPLLRRDALWMYIATHPDLLELIKPVLGENIALFASHYICKEPHVGLEVLPHQDVWPLVPMEVVSCFVAVDECSSRNGGLMVVPRSHKPGLQEHRVDPGENVFGASLASDSENEATTALELSPGDVVLMHGNTVHSSAANTSSLRRCALTLRYIPTSTRVTNQSRSTSYLWMAAGEPVPRVNYYHSWPRYIDGYHPPFPGCESFNELRRVNFVDEVNFQAKPDEHQIAAGEARAREDVANVVDTLAKGKRRAVVSDGASKANRRFSTALWRSLHEPLCKMIAHPFVAGVRNGTIDESTMRFYLAQDFLYLVQYGRAAKILSARVPSEHLSRFLGRVAAGCDPRQLDKHFEFADLQWDQLKTLEQAPYTRLYTDHLLAVASLDPYPCATAAFLPCPMSYQRLFSDPEPDGSPPSVLQGDPRSEGAKLAHAWVSAYRSESYRTSITKWEQVIDEVAANASPIEQQAMLREFDLATRMEHLFWDMSWNRMEKWGGGHNHVV